MKVIFKELDLRIKNEEVTGTCNWIEEKKREERKHLDEYLNSLSTENYTAKQKLILHFVIKMHTSILDMKELNIDLSTLDEADIAELMVCYDLENPAVRYQTIKTAIASPESYMTGIPYSVIRELYSRGKVPFDRQIFAACLIRFNVWHGASYSKEFKEGIKERFHSLFPKDDFTIDILMAVFEMELGVDNAFYMDRELNIGAIIIELVTSGHIERAVIQQKLFDAFNNPTLKQTTHGWAKNIYRDLAFSVEENIACQNQLIQLLYNDRNLLVNFGLQELKKIANSESFNWELFINSLDGIVYAEKLTGGLKTALSILYKGIKKDEKLIIPSCVNLAPIFLQEDNKVQVAAQKCFELLKKPNHEVQEALLPFLDTMHTEVKSALSFLLGDNQIAVSYESYKQVEYIPEPCAELDRIQYINSEDDFIFLTSKVLKSDDALDYELFLEGILRYHYLKDTKLKTLQPALKQAKKIAEEEYLNITARVGVHHVMVAQLICMWLSRTPFTVEMLIEEWKEKVKKEKRSPYTANRWYALFQQFQRISYIIHQILDESTLPLLSTPTHGDFEIDPNAFLDRLNQYKIANKTPNETDFCIAISRLNRWSPISKEKLSNTSEYDAVLHYLLNQEAVFEPKQMENLNLIWLTVYALKNPDKSIDSILSSHKKQSWIENPTTWNWQVGRTYSENRKYSWAVLEQSFIREKTEGLDLSKNNHLEQQLNSREFIIADTSHWFSRSGYLQDPLYLNIILNTFGYVSDLEASETKSILETVKYSAGHPLPLNKVGYLFLTLSLFCNKTAIRAGAFDWLSLLIDHKYLNVDEFISACSKIISHEGNLVPMARVAEQFDRLLQMQNEYVDVLHKVAEDCLAKINLESLPKGFSKMLHHYYEVLQIINQPIPQEIIIKLEAMQQINAVKKEAKKILNSHTPNN